MSWAMRCSGVSDWKTESTQRSASETVPNGSFCAQEGKASQTKRNNQVSRLFMVRFFCQYIFKGADDIDDAGPVMP